MSVVTWPGTVPFPNMYTTCVFTVLQYTGVSICTCTGRSSDQFADDVPNTPYSWKNFILNQNRVYSNFFHCWAILRNLFQQLDSRCVKSNLILLCVQLGQTKIFSNLTAQLRVLVSIQHIRISAINNSWQDTSTCSWFSDSEHFFRWTS